MTHTRLQQLNEMKFLNDNKFSLSSISNSNTKGCKQQRNQQNAYTNEKLEFEEKNTIWDEVNTVSMLKGNGRKQMTEKVNWISLVIGHDIWEILTKTECSFVTHHWSFLPHMYLLLNHFNSVQETEINDECVHSYIWHDFKAKNLHMPI